MKAKSKTAVRKAAASVAGLTNTAKNGESSGGAAAAGQRRKAVKKPSPAGKAGRESIYQRLDGKPAIEAALEEFYSRVLGDSQLKGFFDGADMKRLISQQRAFFTQALGGGSACYRGPTMKQAHAHLPIEQKHFERVAVHLSGTLAALSVPRTLMDEVMAAVAPLAGEIVTTRKPSKLSNQRRGKTMNRNKAPQTAVAVADPHAKSVEEADHASLQLQRT